MTGSAKVTEADRRAHKLKTWPGYFQEIVEGRKTYEFRVDDRGFAVGDRLDLEEWDPDTCRYSGATHSVNVTSILHGPSFGLPNNTCIMAIEDCDPCTRPTFAEFDQLREAAAKLYKVCRYIEEDGKMFNSLTAKVASMLQIAIAQYEETQK